ncbi:site-specific tyrosine recombinase/integron integrase [Candidatus Thioglobus sp.]|uniref:site-specific tyrosine recombinase/integron integrase n=1 Tax=Candidatus Thioglobus sp. TaxID=2026721 RepID=UPI0017779FBF|nr:site-specific tyrosine recombinase/integron integrase [Candidatus Thioglobus sp.]HIF47012.1 tyrosine recombinase XerC [Candidatus Thioglobus sp.]HIL03725.1 tyrosine recombinase XerC [Candidatus Thioglobus autotrophicus]
MKKQIIDFISYLKIERNYAINTQQAYERDLNQLIIFLNSQKISNWPQLTSEVLNLFIMQLRHKNLSSRSIRRYLSSVRGLLTYLVNQGQLKHNCAAQLSTPRITQTLPETLNYEQLLQLLKPQGGARFERRDVAIIEVIYSCGLRVSELVNLNVDDVDLSQGFLTVMGKGGKTRHTPLGTSAQEAINQYVLERHSDALFVNKNGKRIGVRSVQNMIKKRALNAGIKVNVYPHMLRHAAATHFLQSSHDLRSTQEFLGHESIKSTQVYTHLDFLELSKVYDKCHPRAKKS